METQKDFTARIIIFEELGRVLLTQRSENCKFRSLRHDIPGGKSDLTELPNETAARELNEETGLVVKPQALIYLFNQPLVHELEDGRKRDVHIFIARVKGIMPLISFNDEVLSYEWLHPLDAMYKLDQAVQQQAIKKAHYSNSFRLLAPRS